MKLIKREKEKEFRINSTKFKYIVKSIYKQQVMKKLSGSKKKMNWLKQIQKTK